MPKRYTIEEMQIYAGDFGGVCLSKEYNDGFESIEVIKLRVNGKVETE